MTADGEKGTLVDPNRPAETKTPSSSSTTDYRYDEKTPAKDSVEEQLRKVQEEQQKLKDMIEKRKKDSIQGNGKTESLDDNDKDGDVAGSPVFSLIQIFN
jgi:hypothetical protein